MKKLIPLVCCVLLGCSKPIQNVDPSVKGPRYKITTVDKVYTAPIFMVRQTVDGCVIYQFSNSPITLHGNITIEPDYSIPQPLN